MTVLQRGFAPALLFLMVSAAALSCASDENSARRESTADSHDGWTPSTTRASPTDGLSVGESCPGAIPGEVADGFGPALGPGPAYPVFPGGNGTLILSKNFPGAWPGQKVLWIVDPAYQGPVLIRGERLDAPGRLGFGESANPSPELRLELPKNAVGPTASASTWRNWPTSTRVPGDGCYVYLVIGSGFSYSITFSARIGP